MAFKSLVCAVSEKCYEIKQGLALFPYFDSWDKNVIAECCRLSSILNFSKDSVILGSESGNDNSVYFILEGTCIMLSYLRILVKNHSSIINIYKSYHFADSTPTCTESVNAGYMLDSFYKSSFLEESKMAEDLEVVKTDVEKCQNDDVVKVQPEKDFDFNKQEMEKYFCQLQNTDTSLKKGTAAENEKEVELTNYTSNYHLKVLEECRRKFVQKNTVQEKKSFHKAQITFEGVFVQTAIFHKGACFGLEKNDQDKFIVSKTKVKCLAIPRPFLLQHNSCNIWNRIRLFHQLYLPKDMEILASVITERKWKRAMRKKTERIVFSKSLFNPTSNADVPVSIRLHQSSRLMILHLKACDARTCKKFSKLLKHQKDKESLLS